MDDQWEPLTINQVRDRFAPFTVDWWVAGGVAIDLFLGWKTRSHEDIDLEMFRIDCAVLFDVFDGWDLFVVSENDSQPWHRGDDLPAEVFGVWGRRNPKLPWAVEIMLADGDRDTWRFRRDNAISLPRSLLTHTTPDGVMYCVPEVQLLFKVEKHRQKDDVDMIRCLHRLDSKQRSWLTDAIARSEPDHPWLDLISNAGIGGTE